MATHYATLEQRFKRLADIEGAQAILVWDAAVMLPKGSSATRGDQLAALKRVAHELLVADVVGEALLAAEEEAGLDAWQTANLREMRRRWVQARALDPVLVEAITRAATVSEMVWRDARAASDFALLRPHLEEVVRLTREAGGQLGAVIGVSAYDALLEGHQPDLRDADIAPLFAALAAELPAILEATLARQERPTAPRGPFPIETQKRLARRLMERLGFDFTQGRLDESAHPFCGGVPTDIRLTTRYSAGEAVSAIMAVLHETGHALYEAGLPRSHPGQPVAEARGIAVHESQSLLIEMQACRAPAFIRFLSGELRQAFGDDPALAPDNLVRLYQWVERSLIRVDADEVTYPLHIVLRHRLERALIAGDLVVADLPAAWNDGMSELVGVVPPDDARGCLQDIHWPAGAFGYFPCYTLGGMLAAQIMAALRRDLPAIDTQLARGEFGELLGWLRTHVHGQGSRLSYRELIRTATGAPLTAGPYIAHLRQRYVG